MQDEGLARQLTEPQGSLLRMGERLLESGSVIVLEMSKICHWRLRESLLLQGGSQKNKGYQGGPLRRISQMLSPYAGEDSRIML